MPLIKLSMINQKYLRKIELIQIKSKFKLQDLKKNIMSLSALGRSKYIVSEGDVNIFVINVQFNEQLRTAVDPVFRGLHPGGDFNTKHQPLFEKKIYDSISTLMVHAQK